MAEVKRVKPCYRKRLHSTAEFMVSFRAYSQARFLAALDCLHQVLSVVESEFVTSVDVFFHRSCTRPRFSSQLLCAHHHISKSEIVSPTGRRPFITFILSHTHSRFNQLLLAKSQLDRNGGRIIISVSSHGHSLRCIFSQPQCPCGVPSLFIIVDLE